VLEVSVAATSAMLNTGDWLHPFTPFMQIGGKRSILPADRVGLDAHHHFQRRRPRRSNARCHDSFPSLPSRRLRTGPRSWTTEPSLVQNVGLHA
jgi:hypothetical protein